MLLGVMPFGMIEGLLPLRWKLLLAYWLTGESYPPTITNIVQAILFKLSA